MVNMLYDKDVVMKVEEGSDDSEVEESDDGDETKPEFNGVIRKGEDYQAVIPQVQKGECQTVVKGEIQLWNPNQNLNDEDFEKVKEYCEYARTNNHEMTFALGVLNWYLNLSKSKKLKSFDEKIAEAKKQIGNCITEIGKWSRAEQLMFDNSFNSNLHKFMEIQKEIPSKTIKELIFYYYWRKSQLKKGSYMEIKSNDPVRYQILDSDDEESSSDEGEDDVTMNDHVITTSLSLDELSATNSDVIDDVEADDIYLRKDLTVAQCHQFSKQQQQHFAGKKQTATEISMEIEDEEIEDSRFAEAISLMELEEVSAEEIHEKPKIPTANNQIEICRRKVQQIKQFCSGVNFPDTLENPPNIEDINDKFHIKSAGIETNEELI